MQIIQENLFCLLILFVCQLEQGSGEIPQAVQLKLSSRSMITIHTDDTSHKGGGGAEGAGSSHLLFSYAQQMIPKTFYSSDENISFQNTQEHTVKFLLSDTFIRNAVFASQK